MIPDQIIDNSLTSDKEKKNIFLAALPILNITTWMLAYEVVHSDLHSSVPHPHPPSLSSMERMSGCILFLSV